MKQYSHLSILMDCYPVKETRKKICNGTMTIVFILFGLLTLTWLIGGITLILVYEQVKYDCGWKQPSPCVIVHNTTLCVIHNLKRDANAPLSCPRLDIVYEIYWVYCEVFGILVIGFLLSLIPLTLISLCAYEYCKKQTIDYCDC